MDINKVLKNNYCIGCGVCAVVSSDSMIEMNEKGQYSAKIQITKQLQELDQVCPFTNISFNEDYLSDFFIDYKEQYQQNIGYYLAHYAGFVKDNKQRETSSSGGILSWLLVQLLKNNEIDGVIHVGDYIDNEEALMGYKISFTKDQILQNRKSRYYPVEMSEVLKIIKNKYPDKKFAIVGIPCFIKAVRLLQLNDEFYKSQIKYTIGIVCGHLKNKFFSESYGLEAGVTPDNLEKIDFRYFQETDTAASDYSVKIKSKISQKEIIRNNNEFYASNWGHGMFKYNACEYCDDVLAETADIVFGDAWLPKYNQETRGTNIITVRNSILNDILLDNKGEIHLENLTSKDILQSQDGGIRHRTEGLRYRLYQLQKRNKWYPVKRIEPDFLHIDKKRKEIYKLRYLISQKSTQYFKEIRNINDIAYFKHKMDKYIKKYDRLYFNKKYENSLIIKVKEVLLPLKIIYWKLYDRIYK